MIMIKPPLGLRPRKIHIEDRMADICEAIARYNIAGFIPPVEWAEEMLEHVRYLHNAAAQRDFADADGCDNSTQKNQD
jgi:hypothetical protein